jgi:hypothetical protein
MKRNFDGVEHFIRGVSELLGGDEYKTTFEAKFEYV